MKIRYIPVSQLIRSRQAQILLPAVMLAPIFILVIYLLFETAKLSITKVRHQYALDNAAYAQMSTASGWLNSMAQVNGALPYRVMREHSQTLGKRGNATMPGDATVFDAFYKAGAVPSIGPNYDIGSNGAVSNPAPKAASDDWKFKYYGDKRKGWQKEEPSEIEDEKEVDPVSGNKYYVMADKEIADNYFFTFGRGAKEMLMDYVKYYTYLDWTYNSQTYSYKDMVKKSHTFREAYFLNVNDCKRSQCAKQSARVLDKFILDSKKYSLDGGIFYMTADHAYADMHSGSNGIGVNFEEMFKDRLFQFAYLPSGSRARLKKLKHGVVLKQSYTLPANRFDINLTNRLKPYVRNTVYVSCPRSNNNCVWPNPISKYSVRVGV